jgi:nitrate reductase gamma subunit
MLNFFYGVYPYIALTIFVLGSILRFDREQYTWKSDSSQLMSKKGIWLPSNLFHIGVLAIFAGHFVGLLTPHSFFLAVGLSDMTHQYVAIYAGSIFGTICFIGAALLWFRRLTNRRVWATSRRMDVFIISWLVATVLLGLSTIPFSLGHASHSDAGVMIALATWVQSVVTLGANPELLRGVEPIFLVHMFFGMTVFLLFPFSRLVHVFSVPVTYLGRAYQIMRRKQVAAR